VLRPVHKSPYRIVAYSRERGEYLRYDCVCGTKNRTYAWSGTMRQARNMVRQFPAAQDYELFWDEDEHMGRPLSVT